MKKYAWAVELDDQIVLDAYDSGSMITYEEVDVDEDELTGRRRSSKKNKTSFLPFILFYTLCPIDCHFSDFIMFGIIFRLNRRIHLRLVIV